MEAKEGNPIPYLTFRELYTSQFVSYSEYERPLSRADFESLTSDCNLDSFE